MPEELPLLAEGRVWHEAAAPSSPESAPGSNQSRGGAGSRVHSVSRDMAGPRGPEATERHARDTGHVAPTPDRRGAQANSNTRAMFAAFGAMLAAFVHNRPSWVSRRPLINSTPRRILRTCAGQVPERSSANLAQSCSRECAHCWTGDRVPLLRRPAARR